MEQTLSLISYKGSDLPDSYRPMVFSKWLRSLRFGNDYFKLIESRSYYQSYHAYIERILSHPECSVKMAVLTDDLDVVLGFSVSRGDCLDYVHVHKDYRRKGIGRLLTPSQTVVITHVTKNGMSFWNAVVPQAKFNPFY